LALALGPSERTDRAINVFYPNTMGHGVCSDFTVLKELPHDCPHPINTSFSPLGNRFRQQLAAMLHKRGARPSADENPLSNQHTDRLFGGPVSSTSVTSTTPETPQHNAAVEVDMTDETENDVAME